MAEQSYNLKYTGKEIDDLLDKANDMDSSAQVPTGGTSGQVLTKKSGTDYDAEWKTPGVALPTGGTAEQILTKNSATDGDASWKDAPIALPDGGDSGQVLTKNSSTNGDASWKTLEAPSNPLPVGGTTGQVLAKKSDTNYDTEWIDAETGGTIASANAAVSHNSIYRGNYLGTNPTTEQYAAISAGTFDDLYIGDYWTIGDVNYRIAAFDYYLNTGDTACTTHHVVIVPDTCLYDAAMNSTGTTDGGYVGSAMRTANLEQAKSTIKTAFGTAHILTKRELLVNAVSNGAPANFSWFDSDVELMNEVQVYGSIAWGAHDGKGFNVGCGSSQLPLFRFDRTMMNIQNSYWLRDVSSSILFSMTSFDGVAGFGLATESLGVRPFFCIY